MVNYDNSGRFHERKNPRLKNYDYAQQGYYFVTICTSEKKCIFGDTNQLSVFGFIAYDALQEIPKHFPDVEIDKFVVMPNHIHAIIVLKKAGVGLSLVVGQYKAYVTKKIHNISSEQKVWQSSFHDHVIRGEPDYQRIWEYIDTNPLRWQEDCFYRSKE